MWTLCRGDWKQWLPKTKGWKRPDRLESRAFLLRRRHLGHHRCRFQRLRARGKGDSRRRKRNKWLTRRSSFWTIWKRTTWVPCLEKANLGNVCLISCLSSHSSIFRQRRPKYPLFRRLWLLNLPRRPRSLSSKCCPRSRQIFGKKCEKSKSKRARKSKRTRRMRRDRPRLLQSSPLRPSRLQHLQHPRCRPFLSVNQRPTRPKSQQQRQTPRLLRRLSTLLPQPLPKKHHQSRMLPLPHLPFLLPSLPLYR